MRDLEEYIDKKDFDVFAVDDVCALAGTGTCLFDHFVFEDWALLCLRFELFLVISAFLRDCGDADRRGVQLEHLPFYYSRYFQRPLRTQDYAVDNMEDLVRMVRDTINMDSKQLLESHVPGNTEDFGIFVKLTEEARRDRQCRTDSGDAAAALKFPGQDKPLALLAPNSFATPSKAAFAAPCKAVVFSPNFGQALGGEPAFTKAGAMMAPLPGGPTPPGGIMPKGAGLGPGMIGMGMGMPPGGMAMTDGGAPMGNTVGPFLQSSMVMDGCLAPAQAKFAAGGMPGPMVQPGMHQPSYKGPAMPGFQGMQQPDPAMFMEMMQGMMMGKKGCGKAKSGGFGYGGFGMDASACGAMSPMKGCGGFGGPQPCRDWRAGNCSYGATCRYTHY